MCQLLTAVLFFGLGLLSGLLIGILATVIYLRQPYVGGIYEESFRAFVSQKIPVEDICRKMHTCVTDVNNYYLQHKASIDPMTNKLNNILTSLSLMKK